VSEVGSIITANYEPPKQNGKANECRPGDIKNDKRADQQEMKNDIPDNVSVIQNKISTGQDEIEDRITDGQNKQLKGVRTMVERQPQTLR
jgi:hypothetical protein